MSKIPSDEEINVLINSIRGEKRTDALYICCGHIVNKNIAVDYDNWNITGVTHWMYLPELKKEENGSQS